MVILIANPYLKPNAPEGCHRIRLGQKSGGDGLFSFSNCQLWVTTHFYVGTLRFGLITCFGLVRAVENT